MMSKLFESEGALLADGELAFKLTCSCVALAPEWEECRRRDEELKSFTKAPEIEVNKEKIERQLSGSSTQREQHSKQKPLTRQTAQKRESVVREREEVERQQKENGSVEGDEERRQERGMKKEGQVEKEQGREEREG